MTQWQNMMQWIGVLATFFLVVFLAYLSSKWVARFQNAKTPKKNIKVIERYFVRNGQAIEIIQIGNRYIAIGIGKNEISYLTELEEEQLQQTGPEKPFQWEDVWLAVKNLKNKKTEKAGIDEKNRQDEETQK